MTATLPRTHLQMDSAFVPKRVEITRRWHRYRRFTGLAAVVLGLLAAVAMSWPAMMLVAIIGLAGVADASLAIRNERTRSNPTIVADIVFTGVAMMVAGVPGPAVGAVVAYFILVVAVLGDSQNAWIAGAFAVVVGFIASFVPHIIGLHDQPVEQSFVAGAIFVAIFGISTIGIAKEFVRVNRRNAES